MLQIGIGLSHQDDIELERLVVYVWLQAC